MGRPRVLRIGHSRWAVKWSKAAVDELAGDGLAGGVASQRWLTIAVEPLPGSPVAEREVLLHEVLHACLESTSVAFSERQEELFVSSVSPVLLAALRGNPTLVRYLAEEL